MTQPGRAEHSGFSLSYRGLRIGIGFLGLALPVVLIFGKRWLDGGGVRGSISDYEYTVMRDYFVATMCAMGVLLAAYRYGREDDYLSDGVALFAVGVALFPTTPAGVNLTTGQTIIGFVHLVCASGFFLGMAYFCFSRFTRTDPHRDPTPQKRTRNVVYRVCAMVIVACLALVVVGDLALSGPQKEVLHPVFWLESIAVWAFSASWLIKGEFFLLRDQPVKPGRQRLS